MLTVCVMFGTRAGKPGGCKIQSSMPSRRPPDLLVTSQWYSSLIYEIFPVLPSQFSPSCKTKSGTEFQSVRLTGFLTREAGIHFSYGWQPSFLLTVYGELSVSETKVVWSPLPSACCRVSHMMNCTKLSKAFFLP